MPEQTDDWIQAELQEIRRQGLYRSLVERESPHVGGLVQLDGEQFISFGSNDYLGLSSDSRLVDAVKHAVGYAGCGSAASPLISGRGCIQAQLEREIAKFEQVESALLFSTGYAANVGTIGAVVSRQDAVFSDQLNHASIIDGCRLSRASIHVYQHNDMEHLQSLLIKNSARRNLIVTDSLFSMDGDFAPLDQLVKIARDQNALLMVDEAHATGVFGEHGRGLVEHFGVEQEVGIRIGTLSKALGSFGGFLAGSQHLIDLVLNRARSYIFSTAQPESLASAGIAALSIIDAEPQRRTKLLQLSDRLRSRLAADNWDIGNSTSQIVPIILGAAETATRFCTDLRSHGFFVPGIRPPTVPEGRSMLRVSLTAAHTEQMVDDFCDTLQLISQQNRRV